MFVNSGGPGGSGVEFAVKVWPRIDPEVAARFDVVGVDPRGVGNSVPAPTCAVSTDSLTRSMRVAGTPVPAYTQWVRWTCPAGGGEPAVTVTELFAGPTPPATDDPSGSATPSGPAPARPVAATPRFTG